MPFDAVFDARQVAPIKVGAAHPVGNKFPFTITNTVIKSTKDEKGGIFGIEFTSPAGSIVKNYNLWNESDTARKIAQGELAWLCHCIGIFQIDFKNDGAALRGGIGLMDVNFQKGQEPSAEKPSGGYVEIKNIYDKMGNEPNAAPAQQQQAPTGFAQQPQTAQLNPNQQQQQPQTGFNQPQGQQQAAPQVQTGWSNQPAQQQQQPQGNAGGWQQGGAMPEQAPWKA